MDWYLLTGQLRNVTATRIDALESNKKKENKILRLHCRTTCGHTGHRCDSGSSDVWKATQTRLLTCQKVAGTSKSSEESEASPLTLLVAQSARVFYVSLRN